MLRRYYNLPIRVKILLWFIPLLVLTITSTGVYSYVSAANEIVEKISVQQTGTAKQAIDHLDYVAQDALNFAEYLYLIPEIQQLLSAHSADRPYLVSYNVIDSINRLMVTRPFFQYLTIYSPNFPAIQFNNKGLSTAISFQEFQKEFHYDRILKNPSIASWSVEVPGRGQTIFHGDSKNKLLLTWVMKDEVTLKPDGVLILGIDEQDIRNTYLSALAQTKLVVFNSQGTVLSDSDGRWIGQSVFALPFYTLPVHDTSEIDRAISGRDWVFADLKSELTGWHVLVYQPRTTLLQQLNRIKWITMLIVLATLIVSIFFSWAVSDVITNPLKIMLQSMRKFQMGDFSQQVTVKGKDEIGNLAMGYNVMVRRIKELIDDVYASELKQKQAEFKLLQSQINPHFLYNTLNTIAWSAQARKEEQIAEMILSLSNMFKISLSADKVSYTLQQEFDIVENYLYLQKMRNPAKLQYETSVDEDIRPVIVPRLILQPLVENAVVHGIEPLPDDSGFIQVRGMSRESFMVVEVTDNGAGIAEDTLQELILLLQTGRQASSSPERGFALVNILSRLQLTFGRDTRMDIQSRLGSGTRITLSIPLDNGRR
ncbi:cache domain-containing sensor histidine kinase [Paenibacillus humicola]|uniref:cache domain-containing sensor histidine kinase n=1 Tax=Paenibacillus humicola TaxID=3110540 RepID=UPI00237AD9D8|nr:sensor histidine kinase [Paenibacillus humicola]